MRLALRLRGLTKGDQVSMDTFLELAEDLLILRFRLSTVALTEWQFTHCIAMAAVHGLLNSVRIEQWKRTQALWNMARNRVRGIVSVSAALSFLLLVVQLFLFPSFFRCYLPTLR